MSVAVKFARVDDDDLAVMAGQKRGERVAVEVGIIRKIVIVPLILDTAVRAALRQLRQELGQIDRVGLCQIVENKLRDLTR